MRCRQARLKLAEYDRDFSAISADKELSEHLRQCPECAAELAADNKLHQLFSAAGVDDKEEIIPMAARKTRVETEVERRQEESSIFTPVINLFRRPSLSFGTVIAVVVLMVLTLVPFRYHHTIGYTITMDGVNQDLAGDIERICEMLATMGLEDAEVDIVGCDTSCAGYDPVECDSTCSLRFVEIKTEEDAQRVVAAFTRIDPDDLTSNIEPIRASRSGTLLDQANRSLLQRPSNIN